MNIKRGMAVKLFQFGRFVKTDGMPGTASYAEAENEKYAEFIVKACNAHAQLVEALEALSKTSGDPSNVSSAEVLASRVRLHSRVALEACK